MKTDQTAWIVQSFRNEKLCLGLFIFFFCDCYLKIKEVGFGNYDDTLQNTTCTPRSACAV